jgi:hypothetical protein
MNGITISRSLVGIFLVAWLPFITVAHATVRAAAHGTVRSMAQSPPRTYDCSKAKLGVISIGLTLE